MFIHQVLNTHWKRRRYLKYSKHNEQRFLVRFGYIAFLLLVLVMVHTGAMMWLEGMVFGDALWLSVTTVTTVGYGDVSAATWEGRLVTTICLYAIAISLMAQLAGEFIDYRLLSQDKKTRGQWLWGDMKDHILIINTPDEDTVRYLSQLIEQIRLTPALGHYPIQILTRKFESGLPDAITDMGVVHFSGVAEDSSNLSSVNVEHAKYVLLLTKDPRNPISDSLTFDVLYRIKELGTEATLVVEVAQDVNRKRIVSFGADIVIRPVRAYPELLVRAMVAPGTEVVLENLFTHDEDHMVRYDLKFENKKWSDIVCSFVTGGAGTPMAFVNDEGVHCNPLPDDECTGSGIISLVNECQEITPELVKKCLS